MIIDTLKLPQIISNVLANKNIGVFNKNANQIGGLLQVDTPPAVDKIMKAKARSLEIEGRYAQEAVAVAQTALEGLEKINNNLEEMKRLVTMATDPMYTDEDRKIIQKEINKINGSIDEIVIGTEYKGHNILDREGAAETAETAAAADALAPEPKDLIEQILDDFDNRFSGGLTSFTAGNLGTDKVDVTTRESALASLEIVDNALKAVGEAMKNWRVFEAEYAPRIKLPLAEIDASAPDRAKLINGAMEMLKYSIMEEESKILLANSEQNPQKVAYLLK